MPGLGTKIPEAMQCGHKKKKLKIDYLFETWANSGCFK